jgi:putative transposase
VEWTRAPYGLVVPAYVVMPEHVHLLVTEPRRETLARAIQALKISVSRRQRERPFWQPRYDDFNVFTTRKQIEKIRCIHRNPVTRGLVLAPEEWAWSSYRYYLTGKRGTVSIATGWSADGSEVGS